VTILREAVISTAREIFTRRLARRLADGEDELAQGAPSIDVLAEHCLEAAEMFESAAEIFALGDDYERHPKHLLTPAERERLQSEAREAKNESAILKQWLIDARVLAKNGQAEDLVSLLTTGIFSRGFPT
jgi:hypothetical protein